MKKTLLMVAAILMSVLSTGCSKDNNEVDNTYIVMPSLVIEPQTAIDSNDLFDMVNEAMKASGVQADGTITVNDSKLQGEKAINACIPTIVSNLQKLPLEFTGTLRIFYSKAEDFKKDENARMILAATHYFGPVPNGNEISVHKQRNILCIENANGKTAITRKDGTQINTCKIDSDKAYKHVVSIGMTEDRLYTLEIDGTAWSIWGYAPYDLNNGLILIL